MAQETPADITYSIVDISNINQSVSMPAGSFTIISGGLLVTLIIAAFWIQVVFKKVKPSVKRRSGASEAFLKETNLILSKQLMNTNAKYNTAKVTVNALVGLLNENNIKIPEALRVSIIRIESDKGF